MFVKYLIKLGAGPAAFQPSKLHETLIEHSWNIKGLS